MRDTGGDESKFIFNIIKAFSNRKERRCYSCSYSPVHHVAKYKPVEQSIIDIDNPLILFAITVSLL